MRRFWILLQIEMKAWRQDPITVLGGIIAPTVLLIAFGVLFGGRLTFKIAIINEDQGEYGAILREMAAEVLSPFGQPYYDVLTTSETEAWDAYQRLHLDGVWVIPEDFSQRLSSGQDATIEMVFNNYNDDRAKNHRLYSAEILWHFYEHIGHPPPPLLLSERYPLPVMLEWFPVIAVGVVLLSVMLGAMMNIFMLTHKEQLSGVTLELALAPRSLISALSAKISLALIVGLMTGFFMLVVVTLWTGAWPGRYLPAVALISALVALFWSGLALLLGLAVRRYMVGAVATILTGVLLFFISGGLSLVRVNQARVVWPAWLFPNIYAVDPLRDMVLFHTFPLDWLRTIIILVGFALASLLAAYVITNRRLRHWG